MYSYTYNARTGGILLNSSPTGVSKEPRPVYASELDILGFDKYWNYDKQNDTPYMWAEANRYIYRGRLVAQLKGGNVYNAPEIQLAFVCDEYRESETAKKTEVKTMFAEPDKAPTFTETKKDVSNVFVVSKPELDGGRLRPIDIATMVEDNRDILDIIEQTTVKKILDVYTRYKDTLDCFHVAFSGGKDSLVLLDLVKKTLPKDSFVVVFGDTGMEFPDTYDVITETERQCEREGIKFYRASSHLKPQESWELFGPPSRVLRWCCSVHKSTPQTLKLREVTGKEDFTGLDFVGVRAEESVNRSKYDEFNYGKKQKGQYSHNSILDWTSAEIWLYIYIHDLIINEAYKKGNSRAGCLFCPMSGGASDYMRRQSYTSEIDEYIGYITKSNGRDEGKKKQLESYVLHGGWNARKNGRDLINNPFRCLETTINDILTIEVTAPTSDWTAWIKTLGDVTEKKGTYNIAFDEQQFVFAVEKFKDKYIVTLPCHNIKEYPTFIKMFRQVFHKAAYCKGCRVCETNCKNESITFNNDKVKIEDCRHCLECHNIDSGCLLFHSTRHPQGGGKHMKSLNSFADHAPKPEWLRLFFDLKEKFQSDHTLGPMMISMFNRFLKDSGLSNNKDFSPFAALISDIDWETDTAFGLLPVNLAAENPQIEWYIKKFEIGRIYARKTAESMLTLEGVSEKDSKSIVKAFKRITETPFGTRLHFGYVTDDGDLVRTTCSVSDHRVILYSLFKFAEKCNDYKEFLLADLLNDSIDRDGLSPTRIFGLNRAAILPMLQGLSARYPDYINASFTNDLEKISLAQDKMAEDVLTLFGED